MAERNVNNSSNQSSIFDTNEANGTVNEVSTSSSKVNTTYEVKPDVIPLKDFPLIKGEKGRIIMIAETEDMYYFDNDEWLPFPTTSSSSDAGTGWAQYGDSNYIEANPLVTNSGQTSVISLDGLTNTIKSQLPLGVSDLYDAVNSKITPSESGDGYSMSIQFKGKNSSNNGDATIFIDIGGSFTRLFPKSFRFNRGAGTAHDYYFAFNFYSLDTFITNGGLMKIESGQGNTQIYDVILQIHRTHKSR